MATRVILQNTSSLSVEKSNPIAEDRRNAHHFFSNPFQYNADSIHSGHFAWRSRKPSAETGYRTKKLQNPNPSPEKGRHTSKLQSIPAQCRFDTKWALCVAVRKS